MNGHLAQLSVSVLAPSLIE